MATTQPSLPISYADELAFVVFWQAYPRKVGKGAARTAWARALRKTSADVIVHAAERFAADPNLPRDDRQFIPHPATWLNQERWEDEPLPPRKPTRTTQNLATAARFLQRQEEIGGGNRHGKGGHALGRGVPDEHRRG